MNQTDIDILKLSDAGRAALAHIDEVRALLIEEQQARHAAGTRVALLEGLLRRAHAAWTGAGPAIDLETMEQELAAALVGGER